MSNITSTTGGGGGGGGDVFLTPVQAASLTTAMQGPTISTVGSANVFKPYPGGQFELFGTPTANFRMFKVKNGHIVQVSRSEGYLADVWIVPEDQDPFEVARAALVAANLEGK